MKPLFIFLTAVVVAVSALLPFAPSGASVDVAESSHWCRVVDGQQRCDIPVPPPPQG